MKLLDNTHPFFRPIWRRAAVVGLAGGWAIFEFVSGSAFWGLLFGAIAAYSIWELFINFDPEAGTREENEE